MKPTERKTAVKLKLISGVEKTFNLLYTGDTEDFVNKAKDHIALINDLRIIYFLIQTKLLAETVAKLSTLACQADAVDKNPRLTGYALPNSKSNKTNHQLQ